MEKLTSQAPSTVGLVQWLFMTVLIMLICRPLLCKEQPQSSPVVASRSLEKKDPIVSYDKKALSVCRGKKEILFGSIIQRAADRHQVDSALVKAIIMAESGYNPKAISKRGAKGLMQLMPKTAEALGVEDSFNPEDNIDAGVAYFKRLLKRFDGDITLALAAYNAGSRKVIKYQGVPPFKETKYYIKKVFKYYQVYREQAIAETGIT
jgi:soluble lytic murein transglycosylase-like protein